ncbi:hypothetical protein B0192_09275 [Leptospira interrogans serovar Australis]|nr:hypothetical protein B0192_09275 [Leptospira interrogans serovar Australis]
MRVTENFTVQINRTDSIDYLHEIETDGEFIFQKLYSFLNLLQNLEDYENLMMDNYCKIRKRST